MKNAFFAALFAMLTVGGAHAGESRANAVQRQVWSQYLPPADAAVLTAMIPEGDAETPPPATDVTASVRSMREGFLAMAESAVAPDAPVPTATVDAHGVKGSWIAPVGASEDAAILYLHGGAYVVGSDVTPRSITGFLATEAGLRCFSLDYPLAPEHPFPAAVDAAVQAYRMLLETGYSPTRIALAGDSAGGGLALALLLSIREHGLPMPAGAYLLSPWSDLTQSFETHRTKGGVDVSITPEFLEESAEYYAKGHDRKNPLISPAFGNLRGLPPLLIHVGSHERLLDDSLAVARNAALADVPTTLTVWPGYPHVFQYFNRDLAAGKTALRQAATFIQECMTK